MAAKLEEDGERGWKREGRNVQRWKTEDERHSRGGREEEEMKKSYNSGVFFFLRGFSCASLVFQRWNAQCVISPTRGLSIKKNKNKTQM